MFSNCVLCNKSVGVYQAAEVIGNTVVSFS